MKRIPGFEDTVEQPASEPSAARSGRLLSRLRNRLSRTRGNFANLFRSRRAISDEVLEELEERLLLSDVGVEATEALLRGVLEKVSRRELRDTDALRAALLEAMTAVLRPVAVPLQPDPARKPFVILTVGVNGAGKTTTIGKLAGRLLSEGRSVMLAAGDTFRAAAVEQLQRWGERHQVPVVAQQTGADSASVIFDALQAARARGTDVLIADTAGRLHTQANLMDELKKIRRVMAKLDPEAPHEVLLVLDAGTGQNALAQAVQFHQAMGVTGLALTKLDGTAKGGIIFAITERLGLPVRYIGVGEAPEDLRVFSAEEFVEALLDLDGQ